MYYTRTGSSIKHTTMDLCCLTRKLIASKSPSPSIIIYIAMCFLRTLTAQLPVEHRFNQYSNVKHLKTVEFMTKHQVETHSSITANSKALHLTQIKFVDIYCKFSYLGEQFWGQQDLNSDCNDWAKQWHLFSCILQLSAPESPAAHPET